MAIKSFQFTPDCYIEREADTMKRANHENIVKFLGLEKEVSNNKKVLIMEYCPGGNLQTLIDAQPNGLGNVEFLRLTDNLVNAIKHMRQQFLVHRDIKPSNILISIRGDGETIYKLADFGAARVLMPDQSYGSLYGTYEYIHPDVFGKYFAHDLDVHPKQSFKDIHELWSVGVTLFEAATGRRPFLPKDGRDNKKIMFEMTSKKENGDISATEKEGGRIEWRKRLPENCTLKDSLKRDTTRLLAGLLDVRISFSPTSSFVCFQ